MNAIAKLYQCLERLETDYHAGGEPNGDLAVIRARMDLECGYRAD